MAGETAVLLVNLGTPATPDAAAVRRYLAEFLSDPRVIELPRWLWQPILRGVVLRRRPRSSARNYRKIWRDDGSPLLVFSQRLANGLQAALEARTGGMMRVRLAMRYGTPALVEVLDELLDGGVETVLVLPLYPQYSATTTASVFDAVFDALKRRRAMPALRTIRAYHDHAGYLDALAGQVRALWQAEGRAERLLLSFHGIPERYVAAGDPYPHHCRATARAVAERLGLADDAWSMTYQARFGRARWLGPATDTTLAALGRDQVESVDVLCPGFATDCLETLEEIDHLNRAVFLQAGGKRFRYIPCLNDLPAHIELLTDLVLQHCIAPDAVS